ncbi:DUF3888 domain-containing protein [Neobacillus endophyticus]|uniref:DUF3888 domain-containing protein n=1 Tax=Neobacillus endophyticus TaxID=2738405 RepID=UPI001C2650C9|nr:DUF3888 domain-containing protein [Neobacillus endophyticus]
MAALLFTPLSFVKAEVYESQKDKMKPFVENASANDFLLGFIQPKVNNIIKKEYGKEMRWQWVKVKDIFSYTVSNEPKYYKVKTVVTVDDYYKPKSKFTFDSITLKITPQDGHLNSTDSGAKVELFEYKHSIKERYTH